MNYFHYVCRAALLLALVPLTLPALVEKAPATKAPMGASGPVILNPKELGRTFEGIGALSAGASSRLLIDYPEPQRSDILDFLFKPNFGAALQELKVEIGGDVNSTDGTEPSIARTRQEFENPKPEYFNRGYEWWLMKEAKKRNPDIVFDVLQWGAPAWIGNGQFYSQDNADFVVAFIKGAKKYHDLDIDYCGCWNEKPYNAAWIKLLRKTLDMHGLQRVKIVADDRPFKWIIADDMAKDEELRNAIHTIGVHYPRCKSTPVAQDMGKPLWSSEDGPWSGVWNIKSSISGNLAEIYSRNYIGGQMTKTVIWSPITCYPDTLPLPGSGMMTANTPWSGYYDVQPGIWATAHTTQFIQPGWKYLAGNACALLPKGGSYVSAISPDGKDLSIVIETLRAQKNQSIDFQWAGDLSNSKLHLWRSTKEKQFVPLADVVLTNGAFTLVAEPNAIYSLTTTTGQSKGRTTIPPASAFPLPYQEDFEKTAVGATPKYLLDIYGAFEVAPRSEGGNCLKQVIGKKGISWLSGDRDPMTLIGSYEKNEADKLHDYAVSCDACFDFKTAVTIYGHVGRTNLGSRATLQEQYALRVRADGAWQLIAGKKELLKGTLAVKSNTWHRLGLRFKGEQITVLMDGKEAGSANDATYKSGMAGIGCGYEEVKFDNLSIEP